MRKFVSEHIYLETEISELRFVGTRIAVADALEYVALGKSFQWISENYNNLFPPQAVAEAVELAAHIISDEYSGRKHRRRPARKTATV
jgi:uncharacterized protein (DUF433 family)